MPLPRDDNGWRVPKKGTVSHKVYKLLSSGKSPAEIAELIKKPPNTVRVLIHRFRHPDATNKSMLDGYHRRKTNGHE